MFRFSTLISMIGLLGLTLVACTAAGMPTAEPTAAAATQVAPATEVVTQPTDTTPPTAAPEATDEPVVEPTAEPSPTAEPTAAVLCPDVTRPAVVVIVGPGYEAIDPQSGERCPLPLPENLFNLQAAADSLYFIDSDPEAASSAVARLGNNGEIEPLENTRVDSAVNTLLGFAVAADESRLAWAEAQAQTDPGEAGLPASLWIGDGSGDNAVAVFEDIAGGRFNVVRPVRFSADGQTLFFTWEPDGLGGSWAAFNGRYDDLWRVPAVGGEPQKVFDCTDAGLFLCLGDFRDDGTLATIDTDRVIHVLGPDGAELVSIPTAGDYAGYPTFNPAGDLFYSVADIDETSEGMPPPEPGTIYRVAPPYSGEPVMVATGEGLLLSAMRDIFLNGETVVVNSASGEQWGTALLNATTGEVTPVEPWPNAYPAAIWR